MKRILMMLVAGSVVGMLTGCGVPKEEHEAVVADLNAAFEEIETQKGSIASLESSLQAEQKKVRSSRLELDDAAKSVAELKEQEAVTAQALVDEQANVSRVESELSSTQSSLSAAEINISELEGALAKLHSEYDELMNRFNQLKKNMLAMGGDVPVAASAAPAEVAPKSAPAAETKSAMDLLDEMGME
jgi:predicted RNase H-like nuclease (RuvC/YqgF family)